MSLSLRPVTERDRQLLFRWANDVEMRKNSFNTDPITWSEHEKWFAERIQSPNTRIYLAQNEENENVGQIRFEKTEDHAVIDVFIDAAFRGKGLGKALLDIGCQTIFKEWKDVAYVVGEVKRMNVHSRGAFIKAKFEEEDMKNGLLVFRRFRG